MTAADVLYVLDLLDAAEIVAWVDGGWGVDALLGEQTRDHNDLDLAINHYDVDRYRAAMRTNGFHPTETLHATPKNFVMADRDGREVDVHLVDRDVVVAVAGGIDVYGPNGLEYEVGSLDAHRHDRRPHRALLHRRLHGALAHHVRAGPRRRARRVRPHRTVRDPAARDVRAVPRRGQPRGRTPTTVTDSSRRGPW